ncbi:MAG: hypothetical protein VX494_04115 [Actinomycetota bacterium]|nr:hypothetical protein [Actinomycetota bacterium]
MSDTLTRIPTGGVARRRAKAVRNRQATFDNDVRRAVENDTFPVHAIASGGCSCGWKQWLMPGATADDWADYHQVDDDHAYLHELEEAS